ncbi:MAG: NTP transferase domain-containing protein, partial [Bacteroidota bacterium]
MAHQKHPKLLRPQRGFYARTEFAFVGTTCARIDPLMEELRALLATQARVTTVTGDHNKAVSGVRQQFGSKQFVANEQPRNEYDDKLLGGDYDLALVNGNHYPATRQIVFVDPAKAGTLERRREQLTDVAAIILCPGAEEVPQWLEARPRVQGKLSESRELLQPLLTDTVTKNRPPVKALILAGGKSTRMGTDKSQLRYRSNQTELERMVALTRDLGLETFVS